MERKGRGDGQHRRPCPIGAVERGKADGAKKKSYTTAAIKKTARSSANFQHARQRRNKEGSSSDKHREEVRAAAAQRGKQLETDMTGQGRAAYGAIIFPSSRVCVYIYIYIYNP
jgi:hypothetical protein